METVAEREVSVELLAAQELEETAKFLDLEPWILRRLRHCEREVTVNLELIRDNGEPMMFRGVRVQHSAARGPYMGPLMFAKEMSCGDGHAQAMQLTWMSALWDLPFGGSAGWIGAPLDELSEREARLLTRSYMESMQGVIGDGHDIVTPQRGGHPEVNAWAMGATGRADRGHLSAVTGKPLSLGGVDREKIGALFSRGMIAAAVREQGMKVPGAQVAIAGFGDESRWLASALESAGASVVAVSDRSGAVFHRTRLEVRALLEFVEKEEVVFGYGEAESLSAEEMMLLPCDVLVLTAGQELRVAAKAHVVVEAGGRVNCMLRKETLVVPSLLADAALRIADYLEWRKSACGVLSESELMRGLQGHLRKTWSDVWEHAQRYGTSLEQSAMALGVGKVAQAMRMR
jgi:glutamate dehydrogenase (NAD(P)+)